MAKLPATRRRQLLQPKPTLDASPQQRQLPDDCDLPVGLHADFEQRYNSSQRSAIAKCLAGRGKFSLIQVGVGALQIV